MTTPALAPWIPGGGTALEWGLRIACPVGVGPGGYRGDGGKVWCLDCGDGRTGRPAQIGDDHPHRDDAHHAARLHADDHEAEIRRYVTAENNREVREKSGWTTRVYALVSAATGQDYSGVWWDGSGYRLVPTGARLDAKGRRVRRRVVELVVKAGFLQQEENGEMVATPDGRAMLKVWQHHRADLAEPWPARHEPEHLPVLPGGQEDKRRQEAARQLWAQLQRQQAQTRAELVRLREKAEREHQAELAAERQRREDERAERERAERARTGEDITLTWSAVATGRWSVTGAGHSRRIDVTLNERDFAHDSYEIRENGYFVSRHRYRHHADAAVRQLLADGVEIGPVAPGPTPSPPNTTPTTRPCTTGPAGRWHQAPPRPTRTEGHTPEHPPRQRAARRPMERPALRPRIRGKERPLPGRARPGRTDRHRGEARRRLDGQGHHRGLDRSRRRPTRLPHPPGRGHRAVDHGPAPAARGRRAVPGGTRPHPRLSGLRRPRRGQGRRLPCRNAECRSRPGLSPTSRAYVYILLRMSSKKT
ncbi:hypothetical protein [Kitasatospora purpeofusca]|uniref:Uncharacterized protein n=1 Tax=Kitasatospora purpeofusca TaxID=67352 RepID=A0ABZ1TXJ0_9ACTN|nr:hypothetical protein [Kitasatospora purpeofusca]